MVETYDDEGSVWEAFESRAKKTESKGEVPAFELTINDVKHDIDYGHCDWRSEFQGLTYNSDVISSGANTLVRAFTKSASDNRCCSHHLSLAGRVADCSPEEFSNKLKAILSQYGAVANVDLYDKDYVKTFKFSYATSKSYIGCHISDNGSSSIALFTMNKTFRDFIENWYFRNTVPQKRITTVHTVLQGDDGIYIGAIGSMTQHFERGNYSEAVIETFDNLLADLENPTPTGRLAILSGPAGTGKTSLIKGLLNATNKCDFIILEPGRISQLTSPAGLSMLVGHRRDAIEEDGKKPAVVFIIEDADEALAARTVGNISEIHSLLNLCDGILGTLLDIRVVATTNVKKLDMEPALLRAGRLNFHCHIDKVDHNQAKEIYKRLGGTEELPAQEYTLAEIYGKINGSKVAIKKETKVKIGFGT